MLTKQEMQTEIRRLSPFNHEIELPYGLRTRPADQRRHNDAAPRVREMVNHAFPALLEACGGSLAGLRVLDVACNGGGFSIEASRRGADYVLGVDVVDRYLEQARFVKSALGCENVEFKKLNVYDVAVDTVGRFDVTLCFGLLYHLENPVLAMKKLSEVTRRIMIVDTNTLPMPSGDRRLLWRMNLAPEATSEDDSRAATNLWRDRNYLQFEPTNSAVRRLLKFVGFDEVRRVRPTERELSETYYDGRRGTFLALRGSAE